MGKVTIGEETTTPAAPSAGFTLFSTLATPTIPNLITKGGLVGGLGILQSGSWTPVLKFGGAVTGITYSAQSGSYYRLNTGAVQLVYAYFDFTLTSKGSATGAATIDGLPQNVQGIGILRFLQNMTTVADIVIRSSGTLIDLTQLTASAIVNMDDADFQNTTRLGAVIIGHN